MSLASSEVSSNASTPNRRRTRSETSLYRHLPGYTQDESQLMSPRRLSFMDGSKQKYCYHLSIFVLEKSDQLQYHVQAPLQESQNSEDCFYVPGPNLISFLKC